MIQAGRGGTRAGRLQHGRVHVDAGHHAVRPDQFGEQHAHVARTAADIEYPHARGDPGQPQQLRAVRGEQIALKPEPVGLGRGTTHHVCIRHIMIWHLIAYLCSVIARPAPSPDR
jgi:hypothetical protein